jgi:gliding motility-associated-like protein
MKLIRLFIVIILIAHQNNAYSQIWNKQYDGGGNEYSNSITILNNSIYITEINDNNCAIIKLDLDGNVLSTKTFNNILRSSTILKTSTNELLYLCTSKTSDENIIIIKLDQSLNIIWATQLEYSGYQFPEAGIENANGDFTICGFTASSASSTGTRDGIVFRINSAGQFLWFKKHSVSSSDYFSGIAEGPSGNMVLSGAVTGGAGLIDISVTHIDNLGNILETYTWGGTENDGGYTAIYNNNAYYISGNTWSAGIGMQDMVLLKLDISLNLIYAKTYGGGDIEPGLFVSKTANGKIILAGQTNSIVGKEKDICILLLEDNGDIISMKNIGTTKTEDVGFGYHFIEEYSNSYYVVSSTTTSANNKNIMLSNIDMINNDLCCDIVNDISFNNTNSNISLVSSVFNNNNNSYNFSPFLLDINTIAFTSDDLCKVTSNLTASIILNSPALCANSPISFTSNSSAHGLTYDWNFDDPSSGANNFSTNENPTHFFSTPGGYNVTLIVSNGCVSDTDQLSVTIINSLDIETQITSNINVVCMSDTVEFSSITNDINVSYFWNFNDTSSGINNNSDLANPIHVFNTAGTYNVLLITLNECHIDSDIITINVVGNLVADFDYNIDSCLGILKLSSSLPSNNVFNWYVNNELTNSEVNPIITLEEKGNYYIKLIINPQSNCSDTIEKTINYSNVNSQFGLLIPNAFSPNNDGINDVYEVIGNVNCAVKRMIIFNRWGVKIYESDSIFKWNGKNNGNESPQGTYIIYLEFENKKIVKTINLLQ